MAREDDPGYRGPGRNKPPPECRGTGEISTSKADEMAAIVKANNPTNDPQVAKQIVDRLLKGLPPVEATIATHGLPETDSGAVYVEPAKPEIVFEEDLDDKTDIDAQLAALLDAAPAVPSGITQSVVAAAVAAAATSGGGLRFDAGKTRLELLPAEWVWALADVMTQGAKKYAARNWEKGMEWSKMVGCILRHVYKFAVGERYDPETGCHHLAMAAWNCLALLSYDLRSIASGAVVGINDIPPSTVKLLELVNSKLGTIDKKAA